MPYFQTNCSYVETFEPEHCYTFTGKCITSGREVSVTVKSGDLYRYNRGAFIQSAFPYLSADEREFLMSGMYEFPELDR